MDASVPRRPSAGHDPVSGRYRRKVVLSEGRSTLRARLVPACDRVERGFGAGTLVLRCGRRRVAALRHQHGHDPVARVVQSDRHAGSPRLVHPRSGSEGGTLHRRGRDRAHDPRPVRGDRSAVVPEDERIDRDPRAGAAGQAAHLRAVTNHGTTSRPSRRRRAAGDRDSNAQSGSAPRKGLRRLRSEWTWPSLGRAVHGSPQARSTRVSAAQVERGQQEAHRREPHHQERAQTHEAPRR